MVLDLSRNTIYRVKTWIDIFVSSKCRYISSGNTGHGTQFLLVSTLSTEHREDICSSHGNIRSGFLSRVCGGSLLRSPSVLPRPLLAAYTCRIPAPASANSTSQQQSRTGGQGGNISTNISHSEAADHAHSSGC